MLSRDEELALQQIRIAAGNLIGVCSPQSFTQPTQKSLYLCGVKNALDNYNRVSRDPKTEAGQ
jgi:hypothetical protein